MMIDLRHEVYGILSAIAPADYQYPQTLVDAGNTNETVSQEFFPHISYWDSDHDGSNYFDGEVVTDDVEFTVDVWERADAEGNLNEVHFQVDEAMRAAGYRRVMFAPQYETDTKIYHYSFKFKKLAEESS